MQFSTQKIGGGLKDTPPDERDLKLAAFVSLPKLEELPEYFQLETLGIKNQGDTDYCTAFSTCTVSELQEGVPLSPEWSFAVSKQLSGDLESYGQDIRTALKVHKDKGAIEQSQAPYSVENKEDNFLRDIKNWPNLFGQALFHKKQSYWKVTGPYDHYDNIRAAMWKFRAEKRGVVTGVIWSWPLDSIYLTGTNENGGGHAIALTGWIAKNLVVSNSYGQAAGVNGKHFISRETINHFVEKYGAYMFIDISPEKAKYYLEHGVMLEQVNLLTEIVRLLKILITKLNVGKILRGFGDFLEGVFSKDDRGDRIHTGRGKTF